MTFAEEQNAIHAHQVPCSGGCGRVANQSKRIGVVAPGLNAADPNVPARWVDQEPRAWRCVVCGPFPTRVA